MSNDKEKPTTRSQEYAQRAFCCIQDRADKLQANNKKEFASFAKRMPTLIHTCGLCEALAFACAKQYDDYLEDITRVLNCGQKEALLTRARKAPVTDYMDLTRDVIAAASWLKRYTEALIKDKDNQAGDNHAIMP